jgi:chemotaxis protein CheD
MSQNAKQVPKHFLHPGEHYVTRDPIILSTLLGSCVAVCLYDPVVRVLGMNHFLLPMRNPAGGALTLASDAGRYGLWAMELLINGLLNRGAQRQNLRAKAFGGGNVINIPQGAQSQRLQIGAANAHFVRDFLRDDQIPLVAEDLGGERARQIFFDGSDFAVYLRRIPARQDQQIAVAERAYLQHTLKAQRRPAPAEFF